MTGPIARTVGWLAVQPGDYDPSSGRGPDWGKAAPVGLLLILLLGVALFFLIRSMNKNLRKVPASFDPPVVDEAPAGADGPAEAREVPGGGGSPVSTTADDPPRVP